MARRFHRWLDAIGLVPRRPLDALRDAAAIVRALLSAARGVGLPRVALAGRSPRIKLVGSANPAVAARRLAPTEAAKYLAVVASSDETFTLPAGIADRIRELVAAGPGRLRRPVRTGRPRGRRATRT